MDSLVKSLEKTEQLENTLDELGQLLEKHIRKEERELFIVIEKSLTENELEELSGKLQNPNH